jgi:carboxypeptidase family protein
VERFEGTTCSGESMRIDLERLQEVFRTRKGRRILIAAPIAITVNILVLIVFLGFGGKESSALTRGDGGQTGSPSPATRGKQGVRGLPGKRSGLRPTAQVMRGTESISGRVVTAEGRVPLAGALVRVTPDLPREDDQRTEWDGPYAADAGGNFRIEGLRHAPYRLRVSAKGRMDAEQPAVLPGHDVEIALSRDDGTACRLEARTADKASPLPGQMVLLEIPSQGFSLEAQTDRQGRFTISGISRPALEEANGHAQLEILVPGFCEPILEASPQGLVIAVGKGITLTGVVTDKSTGRPIPGATVRSGSGHAVETDGSGAYRIEGAAGSLVALVAGYAPEGRDLLEFDPGEKEVRRVDFHLVRGMTLHGRVADGQGAAIAGVKVSVLVDVLDFTLNDRRLEDSVKDLLSSTTDGAGNYRISGLPAVALNLPGTLSLEVRPPGQETGMIEDVDVQAEEGDVEHAIVLDLSGAFSGTVIGPTGEAVVGAKVSLRSATDGVAQVAATDQGGGFQFGNLPAGGYHLEVEAPERAPFSREITVPSAPLQLRLPR